MSERLRILVGVYLVRGPMGGLTWHYAQYAMGLARLGHDVYVLEDSGDHEWCCYHPTTEAVDADPSYGLDYAHRCLDRLGLGDRWAYHDAIGGGWYGPAAERIDRVLAGADLFLNLSGAHVVRDWMHEVPRRAFVDTDPVFRQIRNLTEPSDRELADAHTSFHTYGENFGLDACTIPDDGYPWRPTRQPVVLDAWPVTPGRPGAPFTTVMRWDSYKVREHGGRRFGMKSESFEEIVDLPRETGLPLEIAFGGPGPDGRLRERGWRLRDPFEVTSDPWAFQRYVQASGAELSPAKHGYAAAWSGWFSERTAAYLASGRPAVAQDTGFSRFMPCGEGLLPFRGRDEAAAALAEVGVRYDVHCRAAREIAEELFDSRRVLPALIEDAMAAPISQRARSYVFPPLRSAPA